MNPNTDDLHKLKARLRQAFTKYARSARFASFVKKGLNREMIRWWNPMHHIAVRYLVNTRRNNALIAAGSGVPILAVVMMRNVALGNPKGASSALVLGTFDFSQAGLKSIDDFARRVDEVKLSADESGDFYQYLAGIYAAEDYEEGRRRQVPYEYSDNEELFFMDVMMRGDDPLQTPDARIILGHPLILLLGQPGSLGSLSEVMPNKIAKLALPLLAGKSLPRWVRLPYYLSYRERTILVLVFVFLAFIASLFLYAYIVNNGASSTKAAAIMTVLSLLAA